MARRLKAAGAASVMPAGSPIGSGQGVLNPNTIRIILEYLKGDDPDYPVIVDAGVGTASDVTPSPWNSAATACCSTPASPARRTRSGWPTPCATPCEAGRLAARAGRIPQKLYATASSPLDGLVR